VKIEKDGKGL